MIESVENIFPIENLSLQQSDTWDIIVYLPLFSPQSFTLTYVMVPSTGGTPISFSSVPWASNPAKHQLFCPSSTTTTLVPGHYQAQAYLTEIANGNRTTICDTILTIISDYSIVQPTVDNRSFAEQMLDAIKKALLGDLGNGATVEYSVAGRTFKANRAELEKMRKVYEYEIRKEKGLPMGNAIYFNF